MRVTAIIIRIIRQFFRDKRTLGLMLMAPMFVLFLMYLVFNGNDIVPKIGYNQAPAAIVEKMKNNNSEMIIVTENDAINALNLREIDAFFEMEGKVPKIILEGSDPTINRSVMMVIQRSFQDLNATEGAAPELEVTYLHGKEDLTPFDNFGPVLIGFFIFFFVFLIAGVSFLRERTSGTLERLLATPLKRWEIVAGYVLGFGIFTTFQAALISWFAINVLGIMMEGPFWYVLLITFLLAMTALTLGILISAFANNELQMIQFIPIIVVPQVFFSGLFNLSGMSDWLISIATVMPLKYGANALREVMIRGKGWEAIAADVYVLLGFSILFMLLNVVALKRYRRL